MAAAKPHTKIIHDTQIIVLGFHVPLIYFTTAKYRSTAIATNVMLFAKIAIVVTNGVMLHMMSPKF